MTDATAGLIGAGFSTIVGTISGISQQNKQLELQEKIAKMSLEQKYALEKRMQDAQSTMERQKILFEALAVEKNIDLIRETSKERNVGLIIIGIGIIALAGVIYLAKKK